jgi:DNA polymerase-1
LDDLALAYPIAKKIVLYRHYSKLLSTYIEGIKDIINPKTGRVHTNYNQTVTSTGRLSSTNPNMQNIPATSGIA